MAHEIICRSGITVAPIDSTLISKPHERASFQCGYNPSQYDTVLAAQTGFNIQDGLR